MTNKSIQSKETNLKVILKLTYVCETVNVDMVFDDDVKLVGLYSRYEKEVDEMKQQIVAYICSETFGGVVELMKEQEKQE